jgi:hypothetical protein
MTRVGRPKLAQVKEVFPVRLPDDRRRALQAEAEMRDSTTSDVIRMHLERYAEITWHDLPKLNATAWCAVFEALGGVPLDVGTVAWIGTSIARVLDETDLADKWSIDASEIASAARAWTFGQACAVADAMARFRRALAVKGTDAMEAARQATTRPAALVLQTPARHEKPIKRRGRSRR